MKATVPTALLRAGGILIHEPGLKGLMRRNVDAKRRTIVGTDNEPVIPPVRALCMPFMCTRTPAAYGRAATDLPKYAATAKLPTRISFMSELSSLAERVGADIELVRQGIAATRASACASYTRAPTTATAASRRG